MEKSEYNPKKMATEMMGSALVLLDSVGEDVAALHLQHALDVLLSTPLPATIEESDELLNTPAAQSLMKRLLGR